MIEYLSRINGFIEFACEYEVSLIITLRGSLLSHRSYNSIMLTTIALAAVIVVYSTNTWCNCKQNIGFITNVLWCALYDYV